MIRRILLFGISLLHMAVLHGQAIQSVMTDHLAFMIDPFIPLEAGSDISSTLTDPGNLSVISIDADPGQKWTLQVSARYLEWDPALSLSLKVEDAVGKDRSKYKIRRQFQSIKTSATIIMKGAGPIDELAIQYRIEGLSVILPVKRYHVNISYSILYD